MTSIGIRVTANGLAAAAMAAKGQAALRRTPMASLMLEDTMPTDHTRNWTDDNGRVRTGSRAPAAR